MAAASFCKVQKLNTEKLMRILQIDFSVIDFKPWWFESIELLWTSIKSLLKVCTHYIWFSNFEWFKSVELLWTSIEFFSVKCMYSLHTINLKWFEGVELETRMLVKYILYVLITDLWLIWSGSVKKLSYEISTTIYTWVQSSSTLSNHFKLVRCTAGDTSNEYIFLIKLLC